MSCPCTRGTPSSPVGTAVEGVQGGVSTGVHRMALLPVRRRVRGRGPRCRGSPPELSGLFGSDGLLVWLSSPDPRGRPVLIDVGAEGPLSGLFGDPCPAPSLRRHQSVGRRRVDRVGARRHGQGRGRGPPRGRAAGYPPHHGPGMGPTVRRASRGVGRRLCRPRHRARRRGGDPAPSSNVLCTRITRCCLEAGVGPARMARVWPMAVRLGGHRRDLHRHQHELALPHRRQTAFHASCPP
jgi:hypothetical protein